MMIFSSIGKMKSDKGIDVSHIADSQKADGSDALSLWWPSISIYHSLYMAGTMHIWYFYTGSFGGQSQGTSQELLSSQNSLSQPLHQQVSSTSSQQLAFDQMIVAKRQEQLLSGFADVLAEVNVMKNQMATILVSRVT